MPRAVAIKPPKIERLSVKDWLKGTVTAFDDGRTPTDGLRASQNVMLDQDGTIRPRPSLVRYGTQPTGTILGQIFEFTKTSGTTIQNYLCTMQLVAGVAQIYVNKDGGAWTLCSGKTYDLSAKAHFLQVDNKVIIMNGVDNLSYLDIPTLTVIPFVALGTAPTPTLTTNTGLSGTTLSYFYKVTANSTVGETAAGGSLTVQVSTDRDLWTPSTQSITIGWAAVTNAKTYNVYLSTDGLVFYRVAAGINGTSFKDDGSMARDVTSEAPTADTTAGPITTRGAVINGQVFLVGDKNNPTYIRYGGTGSSILDFSPFNGGGWTEVGHGTKELPVNVLSFRDGRGNAQITVLCRGTNGTGKRYLLTPDTVTSGSTVISFFDVTEDNGQAGTNSPDGVVVYNDNIYYPSTDGFKSTGTKPQLQNILSTDTVSETILNDVKNLNNAYMDVCVGIAYQNKLYWALPVGSTTNNQIWTLDLQRGGAWMKPWSISASWMTLYNDNSGATHFLILSNNVLFELTDSQATYDDGVAFSTSINSGIIKFSDDGMEWAKVIDITFMLLRPQGGPITFTVSGKTEEASIAGVGASTFTSSSSVAGWGEAGYAGWGGSDTLGVAGVIKSRIFGWSNFSVVPVAFGDAQKLVNIEIDETLNWLEWELDTSAGATNYQLADVVVRYVPIGVLDF